MSLILAIEPDRRQAAQLTGVIRHYVGAELILADTTEGALVAIGRRVPDLVLVPALLAPQDDAALASALRVIAAAAHVRTLTIPVFANGVSHSPRGGMLARLGLGREAAKVPEGCQPSVFAEQVLAYLQEAGADREAIQPPERYAPATLERIEFKALEPIGDQSADPNGPDAAQPNTCGPADGQAEEAPEPNAYEAVEPITVAFESEPVDRELSASASVEEETGVVAAESDADDEEEGIDLSDELMSLCEEEDDELENEQIEVYSIDVTPEEVDTPTLAVTAALEAIIDATALAALVEYKPTVEPPVSAEIAELQAALDEPIPELEEAAWDDAPEIDEDETGHAHAELWMPLPAAHGWPVLNAMVSDPRPVFVEGFNERDFVREPHVIAAALPTAVPAPAPAAVSSEPTKSEWVELIESLRLDIERLKSTPEASAASAAPRAAAPATCEPPSNPNRRVSKRAQPIQDEWGFFDPERCGFAALLAKLDEITEGPEEPAARRH